MPRMASVLKSALTKKGEIPKSNYYNIKDYTLITSLFRHKQAPFPFSPQISNRFHLTGDRKKGGLGGKRKGGGFSKHGLSDDIILIGGVGQLRLVHTPTS